MAEAESLRRQAERALRLARGISDEQAALRVTPALKAAGNLKKRSSRSSRRKAGRSVASRSMAAAMKSMPSTTKDSGRRPTSIP
jgi:hypothetical protein